MNPKNHPWYKWRWLIISLACGVLIIIYVTTKFLYQNPIIESHSANSPSQLVSPNTVTNSKVPNLPNTNKLQLTNNGNIKPKLGHFPYVEADINSLIIIGSYAKLEDQRFERLAQETALALMKMTSAARDEGIWIIPVSGFRDIVAQDKLFNKQIEKRGSVEAAAKLSAPPGYSEHHTGYALDLADGHTPKKDITYEFAKTPAFQWLKRHANEYGFELSFPENNSQGVSYEPWHWRFIGSSQAQEIFKRVHSSIN